MTLGISLGSTQSAANKMVRIVRQVASFLSKIPQKASLSQGFGLMITDDLAYLKEALQEASDSGVDDPWCELVCFLPLNTGDETEALSLPLNTIVLKGVEEEWPAQIEAALQKIFYPEVPVTPADAAVSAV